MAQLTPREEEVLTLSISGCTDVEIGVVRLGKALRKAMGRRQRLR